MHTFALVHTQEPHKVSGGSRKGADAPQVSIITAAYNAAESLPATIASVAGQTSGAYEYIVVDGGSTDESLEVLRSHDTRIDRWISASDQGMYDAMNKGAAMAKGRFLAFLNADDRYLPHAVEQVVKAIEAHPTAEVFHGNIIKVKQLGESQYEREERPQPDFMPQGMGIFHPASFVRRELFESLGAYDLRYKQAADYAFFLQVWQLNSAAFVHIDRPLTYFSLEGISNASCDTYAEAVDIQKRYNTGTAQKTQKLFLKCRRKMLLRRIIFGLARYTGTQAVIQRALRKRWRN